MMDTVPDNFLGLERKYSAYETARFAVLPVPYDLTACYQAGSRNGPAAIIAASPQLEYFDEEVLAECYQCGIATMDPVEPNVAGPEQMHEELFAHARPIVKDGKFLIALGGEHGITSALVRAVMSRHKKLSVLQIDAHCDLRDEYQGSRYSHACVMRRVMGLGANVVAVGIRNIALEEHRFMTENGLKPISARECHEDPSWMDRALDQLGDSVYLSVDIDAFDPAYAPGTGTPEPGGLDWYQVTALLKRVVSERKVVAADIVEVMPIPGQAVTEFLAARLAYKLIAYVQQFGGLTER
jgi:agmatinase